MIDILLEPLRHPFMLRALAAAMLVGVTCSVVGCFIVLRGMAFFGDALAHAVLPGVAVGYLLGGGSQGHLLVWGLVAAIGAAVAIGMLSRSSGLREDTTIGIVFAGMFAVGVALISSQSGYAVDLTHILFGDILAVSRLDLVFTAALAVLVVGTVGALFKEFLLLTFDPMLAETLRLPTGALYYLLLVLVAVTSVVSIQTVGVSLVVAMLVTPAATGTLLARRAPGLVAIAALVGGASGIVGLYLSYYAEIASGPAIVIVCTGMFAVAYLFAPHRGWYWRARARTAPSGL